MSLGDLTPAEREAPPQIKSGCFTAAGITRKNSLTGNPAKLYSFI